jgi:hypothetical protein
MEGEIQREGWHTKGGQEKKGRSGYRKTSGIQREENKEGRREYRRKAGI